jgi:hypothetical protein|uniref:Uncharacterized protein n=1 Tax=viral metagenome TaxID=1070528 RepID=A0A6C0CBX4_9ZZZZ
MEEEKIFKDLTKKYADLAKKIHSKDRRSMSLIKDCSKRIALLDKLRVLEGSYLKCLKNKVKRGQKGGVTGEQIKQQQEAAKQQEDDANQQEAANKEDDIVIDVDDAISELDATNTIDLKETTEPSVIDKNQRALAVCTTALVKTIELKEKAKEFIEKNKEAILEAYENINIEQEKEILRNESIKLAKLASATLKENTGMDAEAALATAYSKTMGLKDRFNTSVLPVLKKGARGFYNTASTIGSSAYQEFKTRLDTTQSGASTGGNKKTTYRLNGEKVVLLHKNKKVQRSIYVKGNGKTKYCKIDHQYILLSKLKNKIQ